MYSVQFLTQVTTLHSVSGEALPCLGVCYLLKHTEAVPCFPGDGCKNQHLHCGSVSHSSALRRRTVKERFKTCNVYIVSSRSTPNKYQISRFGGPQKLFPESRLSFSGFRWTRASVMFPNNRAAQVGEHSGTVQMVAQGKAPSSTSVLLIAYTQKLHASCVAVMKMWLCRVLPLIQRSQGG